MGEPRDANEDERLPSKDKKFRYSSDEEGKNLAREVGKSTTKSERSTNSVSDQKESSSELK